MEVDKDTIFLYIKEAENKIEMVKNDITASQYRIKQSEKEIVTMEFLINQYNQALHTLELQNKRNYAQENHVKML